MGSSSPNRGENKLKKWNHHLENIGKAQKKNLPPFFNHYMFINSKCQMVSKYLKFSAGLGREMVREVSDRKWNQNGDSAWWAFPMASMYGIFTYIYHKNQPNVGIYTIHGWYGFEMKWDFFNNWLQSKNSNDFKSSEKWQVLSFQIRYSYYPVGGFNPVNEICSSKRESSQEEGRKRTHLQNEANVQPKINVCWHRSLVSAKSIITNHKNPTKIIHRKIPPPRCGI